MAIKAKTWRRAMTACALSAVLPVLLLVLKAKALIFVDGRYQIQARQEVDPARFATHYLFNDLPEK